MNYNLEMERIMKEEKSGKTLLLHACCAPCSSSVLERLADFFKISILYYNPNITNVSEYNKRLYELKRFIGEIKPTYQINIVECSHNPKLFFDTVKGLENEPERGKRCYKCYELRLDETAKIAKKMNFDYFATTLTLSPYKNSDWLNEIGYRMEEKYSVKYLCSDFKKRNGYKRSIELSKIHNLYRQDYCGCVYSKAVRDEKIKSNK